MSKNSVELQRIVSTKSNGSTMSASESFTHTVMSPMGPLYASVPDAQSAHKEYHHQLSRKSSTPTYQPPGDPDAPNEYDVIPEGKKSSGRAVRSTSPVVVAENVLYGDQNAAEQMKHRALTIEKGEEYQKLQNQKRFSGTTSQSLRSDSDVGYSGTCCRCHYVCIYFSIIVVFLIAVAALVLALIILLGVYNVCDCQTNLMDSTTLQNLQNEVNSLKAELSALRSDAEVNITVVSSELTQLNDNLDAIRENVTDAANDVINQRITEDGTIIGLNFSVQLSGVRLYDGCQTRIEETCTVAPGTHPVSDDGNAVCITSPADIRRDDTYVVDASCVRNQDSLEQNPFLTLLDVFDSNNQMFCYCYVVVPNYGATPFAQPATCGLQVTRCPKTLSIPANIVTTQTNFTLN